MTELEPDSQKSKFVNNPLKGDPLFQEQVVDFFKRNRLIKKTTNSLLASYLFVYLFASPNGREILKREGVSIFKRENRVGLLEHSIFNDELYFPNKEETSLETKKAVAGRWIGYDFNRKTEFGQKAKTMFEGRILSYMIREIVQKDPNDYTPTTFLNILDIAHVLYFDYPTISELIGSGFVSETTYGAAYDKVGQYSKHKLSLALKSLTDEKVYTINPKANGLVAILKDTGQKKEKPKEATVLKPALDIS